MSRAFHRIWFGNNAIPERYERYWQAWQRQFPDCRFLTWTDADIDRLPLVRSRLREVNSHACQADLARYEILYNEGGIYLDCDIAPHNHFAIEEMTRQLTVCNETNSTEYCSIGFIAAPPRHPVFAELIDHILNNSIDESRPNISTGPWLFGAALKRHSHKRLPPAAFYPYLYDEPMAVTRQRDLSGTFGIHVWGGSWLSTSAQHDKARQLLARGDILEPEAIASNSAEPWGGDILALVDTIRHVRSQTLEVVSTLFGDLAIRPQDLATFEVGKVADWLLSIDRDRVIWQVGARTEPLRVALVNYDPPAGIIDPDPDRLARLTRDYAAHRHVRVPIWPHLRTDGQQTSIVTPLEELLSATNDRAPQMLIVDLGGASSEIIAQVLVRGHRPLLMQYPQTPEAERDDLLSLFADQYVMLTFDETVVAYRYDIIVDYARTLYVNHGYPTLFFNGISKLNGLT